MPSATKYRRELGRELAGRKRQENAILPTFDELFALAEVESGDDVRRLLRPAHVRVRLRGAWGKRVELGRRQGLLVGRIDSRTVLGEALGVYLPGALAIGLRSWGSPSETHFARPSTAKRLRAQLTAAQKDLDALTGVVSRNEHDMFTDPLQPPRERYDRTGQPVGLEALLKRTGREVRRLRSLVAYADHVRGEWVDQRSTTHSRGARHHYWLPVARGLREHAPNTWTCARLARLVAETEPWAIDLCPGSTKKNIAATIERDLAPSTRTGEMFVASMPCLK